MTPLITWLLPWSAEPIGDYYVPPEHWFYYDAGFIVAAWLGWRLRQRLEAGAYERSLQALDG
jgi:hypothetical protein